MITNEYTVWCENGECSKWHQESVGVNGKKTQAIVRFKEAGWEKVKRKWYCPSCYAKYVVNRYDESNFKNRLKR